MDGQFPITEDYGCQPGYPLNQNICPPGQGFHRGVDYGYPEGTPVLVNGVQIGLSGSTGEVTGPHLHVGHWVNGTDVNPGRQGSHVNGGYVIRLGHNDPVNGNYVHVQDADGSYWVYLHLSRIDVTIGQELNGADMPTLANETFVKAAYQIVLGRDASDVSQEEIKSQVGKQVDTLFFELAASAERDSLTKEVITDFFKGALQRFPSEAEIQGWLKHGLHHQADGITNSPEAKQVTQYYQKGKG